MEGPATRKTVPLQRESNLEHDRPRHQTSSKSFPSLSRDAGRARSTRTRTGPPEPDPPDPPGPNRATWRRSRTGRGGIRGRASDFGGDVGAPALEDGTRRVVKRPRKQKGAAPQFPVGKDRSDLDIGRTGPALKKGTEYAKGVGSTDQQAAKATDRDQATDGDVHPGGDVLRARQQDHRLQPDV